jgi:hypothetical protein
MCSSKSAKNRSHFEHCPGPDLSLDGIDGVMSRRTWGFLESQLLGNLVE